MAAAVVQARGWAPPGYLLDCARHFEGVHDGDKKTPLLEPEMCPAARWTVGYGEVLLCPQIGRQLIGEADRDLAMQVYRSRWPNGLSEKIAREDLAKRYAKVGARVEKLLKVNVPAAALAALVAFEDNTGGLAKSTLLKEINAGNMAAAANQFPRWIHGGGRVLPGLVRRRAAERAMFEGKDWRVAAGLIPMDAREAVPPQAAEPIPAPMKPPLQSRSIIGAGIGAVAAAAPLVDLAGGALMTAKDGLSLAQDLANQAEVVVGQVQAVAGQAQSLSGLVPPGWAPWLASAALAAALAYMAWRRIDDYRQRGI